MHEKRLSAGFVSEFSASGSDMRVSVGKVPSVLLQSRGGVGLVGSEFAPARMELNVTIINHPTMHRPVERAARRSSRGPTWGPSCLP